MPTASTGTRAAFATAIALLLVTAPPLLVAFAVSPEALDAGALSFVPDCPSRLAGTTCGLCGMSHAFAAMADGNPTLSAEYNPQGPMAFTGAVAVAIASIVTLVVVAVRSRREGQSANTSVQ